MLSMLQAASSDDLRLADPLVESVVKSIVSEVKCPTYPFPSKEKSRVFFLVKVLSIDRTSLSDPKESTSLHSISSEYFQRFSKYFKNNPFYGANSLKSANKLKTYTRRNLYKCAD